MRKNNTFILLGFLGFMVEADNWIASPILPGGRIGAGLIQVIASVVM